MKMIRLYPQLPAIPGWIFMPIIVVVSFVSVYTMSQSIISLLILVLIGIFAYSFRKLHYPQAPLILGYVLGKPFEDNLRLALAIGGDAAVLLQSGVAIFLWIGVAVTVIVRIIVEYRIDIKPDPSSE
jgi:putative tricarboxylic transport membrane protein